MNRLKSFGMGLTILSAASLASTTSASIFDPDVTGDIFQPRTEKTVKSVFAWEGAGGSERARFISVASDSEQAFTIVWWTWAADAGRWVRMEMAGNVFGKMDVDLFYSADGMPFLVHSLYGDGNPDAVWDNYGSLSGFSANDQKELTKSAGEVWTHGATFGSTGVRIVALDGNEPGPAPGGGTVNVCPANSTCRKMVCTAIVGAVGAIAKGNIERGLGSPNAGWAGGGAAAAGVNQLRDACVEGGSESFRTPPKTAPTTPPAGK